MPELRGDASPSRNGRRDDDPLVGRVFNRQFQVIELIDRGGMAKIYRAVQSSLKRSIALKVMDGDKLEFHSADLQKRFHKEAAACSKLKHPNTVTIFDYGTTSDGIYYIAMELLEGYSLEKIIGWAAPLPVDRTLHIARQIARSLREAHAHGIVHRDLKPSNVLLVRHDEDPDFVKVVDFGLVHDIRAPLAKSDSEVLLGTPKYMAPELIQGDNVDGRCDIYALGVIMYEMLTGEPPFVSPNRAEILAAHIHASVRSMKETNPSVDVPPALEKLITRCLAKEPEERYGSIDELLVRLRSVRGARFQSDDLSSGSARLPRVTSDDSSSPLPPLPGSMGDGSSFLPIRSPALTDGDSSSLSAPLPASVWDLFHSTPGSASASHAGGTTRLGGSAADAKKDHRPRTILVAAGIVALTLTVAIIAVLIGGDVIGDQRAHSNEALTSPTVNGMTPTAHSARVRLSSKPRGATVWVDEKLVCRATPCEVRWDVEPHRPVTFRFTLRGAPDVLVTRTIDDDFLIAFFFAA